VYRDARLDRTTARYKNSDNSLAFGCQLVHEQIKNTLVMKHAQTERF